jgi:hypothetical protein
MKHFRGSITKSQVEDMVKKIDRDNSGSINCQGKKNNIGILSSKNPFSFLPKC